MKNMVAVFFVYLGTSVLVFGIFSMVLPMRFLGIHTRLQGAFIVGAGFLLINFGWSLPTTEVRVAAPRTELDKFVPVYQFYEVHSIHIKASRMRVYHAVKEIRGSDIRFFRTLTWIRRFGRSGRQDILNPGDKDPILDVATRSGFRLLADQPEREIVLGTIVIEPDNWPPGLDPKNPPTPEDFKTLHEPGFAIAGMNFLIDEEGPDACLLTTETRVWAADATALKRFSAYWRTIYPGSALIRRMWLRAVKNRAEY